MLFKKVISTGVLLFLICSLSKAQQMPADTSRTFFDRILPESHIVFGGSITANTYGLQAAFPTFWVKERIKIELLAGFFWNDFSSHGFDLNPAAGGRAIYYFKKQPLNGLPVNSLYAGVSGMSTKLMFFGRDITEQSQTNVVIGYSFSLNPVIQIAPELSVGYHSGNRFRPALGLNMSVRF